MLTAFHSKYFAYEFSKHNPSDSLQKFATALIEVQVDLNPHQYHKLIRLSVEISFHTLDRLLDIMEYIKATLFTNYKISNRVNSGEIELKERLEKDFEIACFAEPIKYVKDNI